MAKDWLDDPARLWQETKLGREEFVQRLLATLVLGEAAKGWNLKRVPSERGAQFLRQLHLASFDGTPTSDPLFIDEFELPARHPDERAGWPDHGVVWDDRLFLIELKTERGSHRRDQLPHYLQLAAHHHPDQAVDLLYVAPSMDVRPPDELPARARYAKATWPDVYALMRETWGSSPSSWEVAITDFLASWIDDIEQGAPLPQRRPPVRAQASWLDLAAEVQRDGQQRAAELEVEDPEELESLRVELRDRLREGPTVDGTHVTHVMAWIWRAETSGGQPLTGLGRSTGYELRLSRYTSEQIR